MTNGSDAREHEVSLSAQRVQFLICAIEAIIQKSSLRITKNFFKRLIPLESGG